MRLDLPFRRDVRNIPMAPSAPQDDLIPCPNCGRRFNETAAERHIPKCADIKAKVRACCSCHACLQCCHVMVMVALCASAVKVNAWPRRQWNGSPVQTCGRRLSLWWRCCRWKEAHSAAKSTTINCIPPRDTVHRGCQVVCFAMLRSFVPPM
jgi:hypothetical protein